jgi:hypothetical protein
VAALEQIRAELDPQASANAISSLLGSAASSSNGNVTLDSAVPGVGVPGVTGAGDGAAAAGAAVGGQPLSRTLSVEPFWRGLSRLQSLGSIPSFGLGTIPADGLGFGRFMSFERVNSKEGVGVGVGADGGAAQGEGAGAGAEGGENEGARARKRPRMSMEAQAIVEQLDQLHRTSQVGQATGQGWRGGCKQHAFMAQHCLARLLLLPL